MRAIVLLLAVISIGILGCTQTAATSTPPPTSRPTLAPTATPRPSPTPTRTPVLPTPTSPLPTPTITPEPLFLLVTEPQGDTIVNASPINVAGSTNPDAVVSINGESASVDIQGDFSAQVVLQEGPNVIEVVASNLQGDQQSVIMAVIYLP